MISKEEALNIVLNTVKPIGIEKVDLESALDMVLAEDIYAKDCIPPFNKSAMDGYAIKSNDTKTKDLKLNVVRTIKAGDFFSGIVKSKEAYKIMTGAPLPEGADCIIQIEKVKVDGDKLIVPENLSEGLNVIKKGEEIEIGELALKKDQHIRPMEIGMLASLGYSSINVYKKPVVALIITGDELVEIDSELKGGKIRNSNEHTLKALVAKAGASSLSYGIIKDEKEALKNVIKEALEESDIIITSGGASVGDYDFTSEVLKELNCEELFSSVAIKPGKPISFWKANDKYIFSLPGNPLSGLITFEEFIKPAIEKIMNKYEKKELFPVILGDNFKGKIGRDKYILVRIENSNGKNIAYKLGSQSSNALMTSTRANGVMIMPKESSKCNMGEILYGKYLF